MISTTVKIWKRIKAMKTIASPGTFDSKGEEFFYLKEQIEKHGARTLTINLGIMRDPPFKADISAEEVVKAGGGAIGELCNRGTAESLPVLQKGLEIVVKNLQEQKRFDAMVAMGGGRGSMLASFILGLLPIGMPKIMISTMAGFGGHLFGNINDAYLGSSIVDIAGLNSISRRILDNAAAAITAMAEVEEAPAAGKKRIAATQFGITTKCIDQVRHNLTKSGYEFFAFHANGFGGPHMERYISEGFFDGVMDITPAEASMAEVRGVKSERLTTAARMGIPQIVVPGAVDDFILMNPTEEEESKKLGRVLSQHGPGGSIARTNKEDNIKIGKMLADRLNKSKGKVKLVLPLKGVSEYDDVGKPFYDPKADKALFDTLREIIDKSVVELIELDCHINDPVFAEALCEQIKMLVPIKL
jgi:uncharacterized protein (UPF0261 family)